MSAPVLDEDGLMTILQPLTGLSPAACLWGLRPERQVNAGDFARVTMRNRGILPRGTDQHIRTIDPTTGLMSVQQLGQRDIRVTILAESFAPQLAAAEILENVRTGLYDEDVVNALNAIGLAFQRCVVTSELPTVYDEEVISAAVMDLYLGGFKLTDAKSATWIETINGDNSLVVSFTT